MPYLIETPVLVRLANPHDPEYVDAETAVLLLHRRGEALHIAPQNLIEFRNVATRPAAANGLGLLPSAVEAQAAAFEKKFALLPETPDIYPAWKTLVQAAGVTGKQVHDARLVAICQVYGLTHILTFNTRHFARLATFAPGLTVVEPADIV